MKKTTTETLRPSVSPAKPGHRMPAVAIAICLLVPLSLFSTLSAAPPDLTNGDAPWDSNGDPVVPTTYDINLGPTGMQGWMYRQGISSAESRQILVTVVDPGSPADGILAVNDVVLGVDGSGANPSAFVSDCRIAFGQAIGVAEANNPATFKLLRWRAGVTETVEITLQTMGAYSATAPYNCPKSALILEQGLEDVMNNQDAGNFGLNVLTLLAANEPSNPANATRQATAQSWARSLKLSQEEIDKRLNQQYVSGESKVAWKRGHELIALAEYYLLTSDAQVLPTIEAMAVEICNGQSVLGATGHQFTNIFRNGGVVNGPYNIGYGAINSAGLPCYYGLLLAKECGVTRPELAPAIARATNFFGAYAGMGAIPYGEHEPYRDLHESNGKSGLAAMALALEGTRPDAAKYNAMLAAASASERERGHNGAWFNYLLAPLGANVGGEEAAAAHFSRISWRLDLNRRWNGGFNYDCWYEGYSTGGPKYNKTDFYANTAMLLTYAMPLRQLYLTGKNQNASLYLSSAEVSETVFADNYSVTTRTTAELVTDLGCWSHKVQDRAVAELGIRTTEHAALIPQLIAIVNDTGAGEQRVGACLALGEIGDGAAAATLAAFLTDSDEELRWAATKAMRYLPNGARLTHLNAMLTAAVSTARPFDPINDPIPLQFAYSELSNLLFYTNGLPMGVIEGDKINTYGVDHNVLYPAIRAICKAPFGGARSSLQQTFANLTQADIEALSGSLVDVVLTPAPGDMMSKHGVRDGGLKALHANNYAEGVPLAKILAGDYTFGERLEAMDVLTQYAGSSTLVNPDPAIIEFCEYLAYAGLLGGSAQQVLDAIAADLNPVAPIPLKSIQSVTAQNASLQLPRRFTNIDVVATDLAQGDSIYTWRKVHGAGEVTFAHNGTAAARNTTVLFDGIPGNYLFEVTMSDSRGLTEEKETVAVTLYDSGGGLPGNTGPTATPQSLVVSRSDPTPIELGGTDPEGYALNYSVISGPAHGGLSGTVPDLIYTPDTGYTGEDQFIFQVTDSEGLADTATITLTVSPTDAVQAAIYEPFDYPAGELNGISGATEVGLDGVWNAKAGSSNITEGSLAFGSLSPMGGKFGFTSGGNANWGGARAISASALASSGLLNDGSSLWMTAVVKYDPTASTNYGKVCLALANNSFATWGNTESIQDDGATLGSGVGFTTNNGWVKSTHFRDASKFSGSTASSYGTFQKEVGTGVPLGGQMLIACRITWNEDPLKPDLIEVFEPVEANMGLPAEPVSVLEVVVDQSTLDTLTFQVSSYVYLDEIRVAPNYHSALTGTQAIIPDSEAPTPNPLGFAILPAATSDTSVSMEADFAYDTYGVEYYFTCTSGGGHDSGWQTSRSYTDTGLTPGAQYSYTVMTRDLSPFKNQSTPSAASSVTLPLEWTVPDVVGMPQPAAQDFIVGNSFAAGTVTSAYDELIPAGCVISQSPVGGAGAPGGTAVDLVVSLGPENNDPVVEAGPDQLVAMAGTDVVVNLDGTVSDADAGDVVTTYWSVLSAPVGASVSFGDTSAVDTTVTLNRAGDYVLRLRADDQTVQISDQVMIRVYVPGAAVLTDTLPVAMWNAVPAKISVTPGEEGFASVAGGGAIDRSFNAAVLDYAFFDNGTSPYASGNSGSGGNSRISFLTNAGGNNARTSLWHTSSTAGAADFTGRGVVSKPETGVGNGTAFTVDISGLGSGSVYVMNGSWQSRSDWLRASMQGAGLPDVTTDSGNGDGDGDGNPATFGYSPPQSGVYYFAKRIDFSGAVGYSTIRFTVYESGNQNGYFSGVVLTAGQAPPADTTPPTLTGGDIVDDQGGANVTEDSPVTYTVTFSEDMDGTTVDASDFSNAGSASVSIGAISEISLGVFTVEATPTTAGTLQLQVSAGAAMTDVSGNALNTATAIADDTTINVVTAANSAPLAVSGSVTTDEDTAVGVKLVASDADPEDVLTYMVVDQPANGVLTGSAPNLTYTPNGNSNGSDSFTFRVNDGTEDSNTATVSITVNAVNDAPVASDNSVTTDEDTVLPITLSATDVDGAIQSYTLVDAPTSGTLAGTAPDLTYTPNSDYNGVDSFTFKASDGAEDSNVATVTLTINAINDAPVFTLDPINSGVATEGVAYSGSIAGSASDVDAGASLAYALVSPQSWLFVASDGTLSGTPGSGDIGSNSFTVSVSDGIAPAVEATLNITVTAPSNAVLTDNLPIALHTTSPVPISVTPGGEGFASSAGTGTIDTAFNNPVLDYAFFQGGGAAYASGTSGSGSASRISNLTNAGGNNNRTKLWETSSTSGPADFASKGVSSKAETGLGNGTTFTVDISGLGSGSVYVISGSWQARSDWLSVSMTGAGQAPVTTDSGDGDGDGNNARFGFSPNASGVFYYAKRIDFSGAEAYDAITMTVYESGNNDGYFAGVVLTQAPAGDTTSPTLAGGDIVDGQGGANVIENTPVTYTVTFSEDMDETTVDATDFSNAGSATVSIGTITETSPGVFTVEVTPTNAGSLQLQVSAGATLTDVAGNPLDTTVAIVDDTSITVDVSNVAPVWAGDPVNEVDATEDAAYSSTLADDASDANAGDSLSFAKVSGPAWLSVAANGGLSGMPTNLDVGVNGFTVSVSDSIAPAVEATLNITVINTNDAPVFTVDPINGSVATEDFAYTGSISGSATDADAGDSLSYAKVNGPAWLNVAANGDLSGTPSNADVGANVFTVSVTDNIIATPVQANLNVTVINTNDAPVASNSSQATDEDTAVAITLVASDVDAGDDLTYTVVTAPSNGVITGTAPNLAYTPNADFNGSDSFTFKANDGTVDSSVATVSITVNAVDDAPVADDQSVGTDEDVALAITLTATDVDLDSLTYAVVTGPANGTLSGTAPNLTYTPNGDFNGSDSFAFEATGNSVTSNVATISITVNAINDAPLVNDDSATTDEDTGVGITLVAYDIDVGDVLSYSVVTAPTNGILTGTAPNLTYTPNGDYNGTDSFTFKANDGTVDSNTATVNITVNAVNDAPVASSDSVSIDEDTGVAITVVATDIEVGDTLTYAVVTAPINGVLSGMAPNLTYTPNGDFNGSDSFTFKANDATVDSNIATVTLTINAINDAPVFTLDPIDSGVATEGVAYSDTIAGSATDVDAGATLSYALESPQGWLYVASDGTLSGTPGSGDIGANSFTVSVSDGTAPAVQATLNITVAVPSTAMLTDNLPIALWPTTPIAISVTPGEEGFASAAGDGSIDTSFNAPVIDYKFFEGAGSYASGGARISELTNPDANDSKTSLWETSSTAGPADYISKGVKSKPETGTGDGTIFTVDISGMESGSVYVINGSWQSRSDWLKVSMTGSGQAPVTNDSGNGDGDGNPATFGYSPAQGGIDYFAKRIDFSGAGAYDTMTFTVYESGNQGGYFSGVVLTQAPVGDTTPPALVGSDIVDDQGGAAIERNSLVTYTVSFSEEMDTATLDTADFSNAGSASVTIGTITETSPGVFAVEATPTTTGTLQLQVSAGAALADVAGNALDTTTAIADDTVLTVNPIPVIVPDVVGLDEATAEADIAAASLVVGTVSTDYSDSVPAGNVISQSLTGGSSVDEGSPVDLVVSLGVQMVNVPDAVGLAQASAESAITAALLTVGTVTTEYSATVPAGDVISQGLGAGVSVPVDSAVDLVVSLGIDLSPKLVRTTVTAVSNTSWITVGLGQNYNNAVIIATPLYPSASLPPVVTRITNVTSTGFDLKIDRADALTDPVSIDVSIMAVDEGVYTQAVDGVTMEAVKFTSTVTAGKSSWVAEARSFQNSYTNPVVVGQVMSANDPNWSVFWSMGNNRNNPVDASNLNVGKHVGEDPNTTRSNETIGYIVIESGSGSIDGVAYEAALGAPTVRGFGNSSNPYTYNLSGGLSSVGAAAASVSGVSGVDGSWAVLSGSPTLTTSTIGLHVCEDKMKDPEQSHAAERVGYIVYE